MLSWKQGAQLIKKAIHMRLFSFLAIFYCFSQWYFDGQHGNLVLGKKLAMTKYMLWLFKTKDRNCEFWKTSYFHWMCSRFIFLFFFFFWHADPSCMVICCKPHGTISNCDGESSNCKHSSLKQVVVLNWAL